MGNESSGHEPRTTKCSNLDVPMIILKMSQEVGGWRWFTIIRGILWGRQSSSGFFTDWWRWWWCVKCNSEWKCTGDGVSARFTESWIWHYMLVFSKSFLLPLQSTNCEQFLIGTIHWCMSENPHQLQWSLSMGSNFKLTIIPTSRANVDYIGFISWNASMTNETPFFYLFHVEKLLHYI